MSRNSASRTVLVIDAAHPHAQADFWAGALHYEPEDNSALVGQLLQYGALKEPAGQWVVTADPEGNEFCVH
ncbi:hypothetical protein ACWDQO_15000 [Streptomyces sp. NPDC003703]|uniref:hypothetical protein n=1 Tax=Streptomyces sp. NPDC003283 TaxID=3364681 RepID=UPI003689A85E